MALDAACASENLDTAAHMRCPQKTLNGPTVHREGWAHHQPPLMCSAFHDPIAAVPEPEAREELINSGASNLSMRQFIRPQKFGRYWR